MSTLQEWEEQRRKEREKNECIILYVVMVLSIIAIIGLIVFIRGVYVSSLSDDPVTKEETVQCTWPVTGNYSLNPDNEITIHLQLSRTALPDSYNSLCKG